MSDSASAADPDTGLACLLQLLRFHGVAADPDALRHHRGGAAGPFGLDDLVRAARSLQIKAKSIESSWKRLKTTPLPAIAQDRNGGFFILAQVAEDKALIHDPVLQRPTTISKDDLEARWTGDLLLMVRRAAPGESVSRFGIKWFIPAVLKHKALLGEVLLASLFIQLLGLVTPLFFQVVIDKVLVHRGLSTLDVIAFAFAVTALFETSLTAVRTYVFSHTTNRIDVMLGAKLFRHLLALPLAYFGARRVGDSVARVRELENIRSFLTGSALTLVMDVFFTVVFFAVLFYYSVFLTWIVLGSIPLFVALSVVVTPILRSRVQEKFDRGAENQAFLVESVTGIETVKAMAVEPQMERRWEEQLAAYVSASFKATNLNANAGQVAQLVSKLTTAAILFFGAKAVIAGGLTIGELVAFNMLSARISQPVLRLAQLWQDFQQTRISMDRLGDILNAPAEPAYGAGRSGLPRISGRIRFEHVSFRYRPDGQRALEDVTLDVPAGQILGIVGPSGSGKSTLAKLLQRLYVPEAGRILVDGVDLSVVEPSWLRRQIGVVLQENVLFNRTIRENIALADPGVDVARVIEAATLSGAHDFIVQLPESYDTMVGERGASLSGGQRQRIAIARALAVNPRILIFDEATSALDYESERAIQQNMRRICQGRTVVVIAHRLAAVRDAHRIVTVEEGRITEDGTHDELLRRNGRYAALYRIQAGSEPGPLPGSGLVLTGNAFHG